LEMNVATFLGCFLLGCRLAGGNPAEVGDDDAVVTSTLSPDEGDEERARDRRQWVHDFFSISRLPQNGSMTLVFPGLFEEDVDGSDTARFTHSNDSRQFRRDFPYVFDGVESLDEDAKQRRRLLAAGNRINLLDANEEFISAMVDGVFSTPRDSSTNETVRTSVVRYLTDKMRSFGLVTGNQIYDPQEFGGHVPNGTNVIGILPGRLWGTKEDEILVIGAHWDTVPLSSGMNDNGSGVTALLEVARALTEGLCRPHTSVIFVAFDLEEVGSVGSIYFIRNFLVPTVLSASGAKLKGAFILDCIMNFNETQFSQTLSPEWQEALPEFWQQLQAENQTGDFLTVMYRKDVDFLLARTLADHWREPKKHQRISEKSVADDVKVETIGGEYRLKKVRLDMEAQVKHFDTLIPWLDLLRSDHSRFWIHNLEEYNISLPAVLITDTGPYRGVMQECYHQACDSSLDNAKLKFADKRFLARTCQALIDSTISLSQSVCHQIHSSQRRHQEPGTGNAADVSVDKKPILPALLGSFLAILQWLGIS